VPTFAIWDDHDAGIDDVFLGPFADKPAWKVKYLELFNRNWNNPPAGAPPEWPGLWHKFRAGPVECFMLDGRYYRENFLKPNPSMLGPVQKAWLLKSLKESTAPFKLLVSPVAWADDAKIETGPDGERIYAKDIWSGFREERTEVYDFLAENNVTGVILLSSDRHRNDVRIDSRPRGYPLLEIESGWLTNEFGTGTSGKPLFEYHDGPAFGCITIETDGDEPHALVEIINANGEPVFRREVKLSELR
jgi:alkaline phosphatase D